MVPNEWEILSLSQVSKVIDCKHRTPHYVESGIPLISPGTIKWGALDLTSPTKRVTEDEYQSLMDHCTVEIGDLVMSRNQSVGVLSFVDSMKPFVLGQDTVLIKAEKSDSKYLFYKIQSEEVQKRIVRLAGGSTFARINLADIRKLILECPPLVEQKKIAQILSTWDQAISTTEKLLENSQQQKKALMQQLLTGKKRLLDENGVRFGDEWSQKLVEEYFDVGSSKRVLQADWKNEGVPFYRTRELVSLSKRQAFRSEIFISDELFLELSQKYGIPSAGDFLVSGVGTLGISYQVKNGDKFYFKDGNVLWFKLKNHIFSDYFKYCFQSDFVQEQIEAQASVTTVGTYTIQNAKKTKFRCPPSLQEQQKIAAVLRIADQEIETLQKKLDCLNQEKKTLMQQLLTGKKRVKVAA
ncbi:restriction endonuclease subunit S [Acinetobacter sp. YK3]|uniref:restriction endonuclease subunit S n=1 Tax=Acinetobacter sp. YK3 TaxID=1860097 RepID=UPI00084CC57E|nr:restriction endonuclease subunit S [Acinetobacter sp. YK3]OEC90084.1 hypothetical protein A9Z07_04970 [Acinetobacter sp. YK3]